MFAVIQIPFIMGVCLVLLIWAFCKSGENNKKNPEQLNYDNVYKEKTLLSFDEKKAYFELKKIADELGYQLLSKVRVSDLVKPIRSLVDYDLYLNELKSRYFDFVLCDSDLNVKYIIEIDNESYERYGCKEKRTFFEKALSNVGYEIIYVYKIDESLKDKLK